LSEKDIVLAARHGFERNKVSDVDCDVGKEREVTIEEEQVGRAGVWFVPDVRDLVVERQEVVVI